MSKHTKGPWVARRVSGPGWPGQVGYAIDYNEDQEQVVDFVYEEADAKLIAASPDLLEALQAVVNYGVMTGDDWIEEKVLAAIAKATA